MNPDMWVFWVYASTRQRFKEGYREIAHIARLPGRDSPNVNILQTVYRWLRDTSARWLLVVDNADDGKIFFDADSGNVTSEKGEGEKQLASYIPRTTNRGVLITTRYEKIGIRFTDRHQDIVQIGPMADQFALALLKQKSGHFFEDHEIGANLIKELDFIPLAISQAAAYVCCRAPQISIVKYLKALQQEGQKASKLLKVDNPDNRRDEQASNSVFKTWQLSFEYIAEKRPTAARLLSLMSFFDREGIPKELLLPPMSCVDENDNELYDNMYEDVSSKDDSKQEDFFGNGTNREDDTADHDDNNQVSDAKSDKSASDSSVVSITSDFNDNTAMLHGFSLVTIETGGASYEMHRLAQLTTRNWLDQTSRSEMWTREALSRLYERVMPGNHFFIESRKWQSHFHAISAHIYAMSVTASCRESVLLMKERLLALKLRMKYFNGVLHNLTSILDADESLQFHNIIG